MELDGLLKYNQPIKKSGKFEFIMVPLLGRFKGETGERYHLTPLAAVTKSGIQVKFWVKLLMAMHVNMGRDRGYVVIKEVIVWFRKKCNMSFYIIYRK